MRNHQVVAKLRRSLRGSKDDVGGSLSLTSRLPEEAIIANSIDRADSASHSLSVRVFVSCMCQIKARPIAPSNIT